MSIQKFDVVVVVVILSWKKGYLLILEDEAGCVVLLIRVDEGKSVDEFIGVSA